MPSRRVIQPQPSLGRAAGQPPLLWQVSGDACVFLSPFLRTGVQGHSLMALSVLFLRPWHSGGWARGLGPAGATVPFHAPFLTHPDCSAAARASCEQPDAVFHETRDSSWPSSTSSFSWLCRLPSASEARGHQDCLPWSSPVHPASLPCALPGRSWRKSVAMSAQNAVRCCEWLGALVCTCMCVCRAS